MLVVHLSFLHAKHLLMKFFFESLQTYANLLLELMPANNFPTRCVNRCLPVFIRNGSSIQKQADSHRDKTRPAALKIWSCPISKEQDQNVKLKASLEQADCFSKKIDCFSVDGYCSHRNTVIEAMGCFYHFCPCQELRPSLTEGDIERGSKQRELDALRRHFIPEKGFKFIEMWEFEWWRLHKTTYTVKQHIRHSLAAEQLSEEIKERKLFGYVECDIEELESLKSKFDNFPVIFKNTLVSKTDIGYLMKNYAEEERMSQPRKMLISSITLQNGTHITALLLFYLYLQLGLVCKKNTALLSTLQRNASTVLCSQQWTQEGNVMKIQIQVSSQKQ